MSLYWVSIGKAFITLCELRLTDESDIYRDVMTKHNTNKNVNIARYLVFCKSYFIIWIIIRTELIRYKIAALIRNITEFINNSKAL